MVDRYIIITAGLYFYQSPASFFIAKVTYITWKWYSRWHCSSFDFSWSFSICSRLLNDRYSLTLCSDWKRLWETPILENYRKLGYTLKSILRQNILDSTCSSCVSSSASSSLDPSWNSWNSSLTSFVSFSNFIAYDINMPWISISVVVYVFSLQIRESYV